MRYSLQCMVIQLCIEETILHPSKYSIIINIIIHFYQHGNHDHASGRHRHDDADADAGKQQQSQQNFSEGELHPRLRRLLCHRLTFFIVMIMMVIIIMMERLEQVFSFRTCPSSRHKGKASHQKSSLPTCPRFKNKTCPRV